MIPEIKSNFELHQASINKLDSENIDLYYLDDPDCELCKVEWIYNSGSANQEKALQASFTYNMMLEGTSSLNSQSFNQKMDELGAYFGVDVGRDFTSFTLHVLRDQLAMALELVYDAILHPAFQEEELEHMRRERIQEFQQNEQMGPSIARKALRKQLYPNHIYGQTAERKDFEALSKKDLIEFFNKNIAGAKHQIFMSGCCTSKEIAIVTERANKMVTDKPLVIMSEKHNENSTAMKTISLEHAKQDSLRLAIPVVNHVHPDFLDLNITCSLLGGYFGSRLMQNIREDKGWTYGVSTTILPGKLGNAMYIATDVLIGKGKDCVEEIKREIERLQNESIPAEELNALRSYLKGSLLRSFDGVFEQMDRYQSLKLYDARTAHFKDYMQRLDSITSEDINRCAKKHLDFDLFSKVVVLGNKEHD